MPTISKCYSSPCDFFSQNLAPWTDFSQEYGWRAGAGDKDVEIILQFGKQYYQPNTGRHIYTYQDFDEMVEKTFGLLLYNASFTSECLCQKSYLNYSHATLHFT